MRSKSFLFPMIFVLICLALSTTVNAQTASQTGKIPITTSSEKAKTDFLKGRDLSEQLRAQDSITFYETAIKEDPNFATAYIYLAGAQTNANDFFANVSKAANLADKVSDGERLWILGIQAGANGLPSKQGEYYEKMVASYPNDERGHNLLGGYYFGLQQYDKAAKEFQRAIEINPKFSPAYNLLGYVNRFQKNYTESEKNFKKYIELVPGDPNPYDSYAELLLKIGRFDESIENYGKALSKDPHFFPSYLGMATDYNLKNDHAQARQQLQKLYDNARGDGDRRAALFAMSVSYVDEGKWKDGLGQQEKMLAIAQKANDSANVSGDLNLIGGLLLEYGSPAEAKAKFDQAAKAIATSNLSSDVKSVGQRNDIYNSAQVALAQKDLKTAHVKADEYRKAAEGAKNQFELWQAHEIAGRIALEEKKYDAAISELKQSNLQDPYNIYRLSLAYQGKGDAAKAKELHDQALQYNALNNLNYAIIRAKTNAPAAMN